jgi:uncharacterized protein YcfL
MGEEMKRSCVGLLLLMALVGCKADSNSALVDEKTIVQKVEDAGISPNDIAHADAAGLQLWFL